MKPIRQHRNLVRAALLLAVGLACGSSDAAAPAPRSFDGYNERFDLGESPENGASCFAERDFHYAMSPRAARVWSVRCRGYSPTQSFGQMYLFLGSREAATLFGADVRRRVDCAGPISTGRVTCKTRDGGKDWLVLAPQGGRRTVAAQGFSSIGGLLSHAVDYMQGGAKLPGVANTATAAVRPTDARAEAYALNRVWRFDNSLAGFIKVSATSTDPLSHLEADYQKALQASNKGDLAAADGYFKIADAEAAAMAPGDRRLMFLQALALNLKAADARNRRDFDRAIDLATQSMAKRREARSARPSGAIVEETWTAPETPDQRESLRDAQGLEIRASSLISLGRRQEAEPDVAAAQKILRMPLTAEAEGASAPKLGDVDLLLAAAVAGDELTIQRTPAALQQYRLAVAAYGVKHPDDMPLGGMMTTLAREEARLAAGDKAGEDRALNDYEQAFRIFLLQRGALGDSANLTKPYFDILLRRIGGNPASHREEVERFFEQSQILIAQSSANAARQQAERIKSGDKREAGLARQLDDVERQISEAERRQEFQEASTKGAALAPSVGADLEALDKRRDVLEAELGQVDPGYKARLLSSTVSLDDFQHALAPGKEAYAKMFVLEGGGFGIFVTHDTAIPYAIALDRQQAIELVARLRDPIDHLVDNHNGGRTPNPFDVALAHEVFVKLFGPVEAQTLAAGHLILEPDATLIGLPAPALVVDDASTEIMRRNTEEAVNSSYPIQYKGVSWLGAKVATSIALSPSAFIETRNQPSSDAPKLFVGFGDPVISRSDPRMFKADLPAEKLDPNFAERCDNVRKALFAQSLPQSAEEVVSIAKSLNSEGSVRLGKDFTDTFIISNGESGGYLDQFKILFFATHGLLPSDADDCLPSGLLTSLSSDPGSNGLLDTDKILKLHLAADLVVLAACNTGRTGDPASSGEALGGLVQSFVEAGTRNVLVSNWSVGVNATKRLMIDLFSHRSEGLSQEDALAAAERDLMGDVTRGYSHPYFWAPFMIVGDGAKPMPA